MSMRSIVSLWAVAFVAATDASAQNAALPDPATAKVSTTATGAQIYSLACAACHQANGAGLPGQFPPLGGSAFVTGDERRLSHIVLRGLTGEIEVEGEMFQGVMPGWAPALSDAQIASVLSYIRSSFGNSAPAVSASRVAQERAASSSRKTPYTLPELTKVLATPR